MDQWVGTWCQVTELQMPSLTKVVRESSVPVMSSSKRVVSLVVAVLRCAEAFTYWCFTYLAGAFER